MKHNNTEDKATRVFLHTPTVNAKGNVHTSGKTEVLAGTVMKVYAGKEMAKMKAVFEQLTAKGIITIESEGKARFAKTHVFMDANEAASFLLHRGGDNNTAWHRTEQVKQEPKKKPAPVQKKKEPAAVKQEVQKKQKPVHQEHPAKVSRKHEEKKQSSFAKKPASNKVGNGSKRKDPRNPRGIRPQGNDAVKAAQKIPATGYVQFAGMGQGVKVKH